MKILLFSDEFPPFMGGIGIVSLQVVNGIAKNYSHKVIALVPSYGPSDADIDDKLDCKVIRVPLLKSKLGKIPFFWQFVGFTALFYCLLKEKPDAVLFLSAKAESVGGFLSKIMDFNAVVCVAGSGVNKYLMGNKNVVEGTGIKKYFKEMKNSVGERLIKILMRVLYKNSKKIIAVSNYTKSLLMDVGLDGEKIRMIYNGISRELLDREVDEQGVKRLRSKLGISDKDKVIITIARITIRKGQDDVIRALPKLREKIPNIKYVVVGTGKYRYRSGLEKLTRELKVENNVIFTGRVENSQIQDYLDMSDLFVMPSKDWENEVEGLGISFLEASARGLPIVVGNSGGAGETVVNNETGLLVEPENVEEIGDAIVEILLDDEKAKRFSANGRAFIENVFMEEKMIESYVEVLEEAAGVKK